LSAVNLEEKSNFPAALLAGSVVVLLSLGGVYLLTRNTKPSTSRVEEHLRLGPAEQAYTEHIHLRDLQMGRAANFLNQEVTFVFGALSNDGARAIRDIEVTVEFRDLLNQVVLRETRRPLGRPAVPLPGGRGREFQLSFEHVPMDWNRQYPTLRVTGLVLE